MFKNFLLIIYLFVLVNCISCGNIPQDKNKGSIETDYPRVETIICDRHSVGKNGCIFQEGKVEGELKIYAVNSGYLKLTGSSCGVDKKIEYDIKSGEWVKINLKDLLGEKLSNDCMISIYQNIQVPHQNRLKFPILGITGTVFLGICPSGVTCNYESYITREGFLLPSIPLYGTESGTGKYIVNGCGSSLVPPTTFSSLSTYEPSKTCMYVSAIKKDSGEKFLNFYDYHIFKSETVLMSEPVISLEDGSFSGDDYTAIKIVDGEVSVGNKGFIDLNSNEQFIRFFTSQGRSIVIKQSKGVIVWVR